MPVIPLAAAPALFEGGMQLVVGIYREVAPTHIIKKGDGKYDEGINILEAHHALMTPDQIEQIALVAQRVDAARPPQPSGPTTLRDLLRNPFNKITIARKYKRICKEYLHLVQRTSQLARLQAAERDVILAWGAKNGRLSQAPGPMTDACHGNGTPTAKVFDVSQAVALEIERAAGPGAEMSVKFRDVKLSVGATTSMNLQFTPSGIVTAEVAVGGSNISHPMTPQPNALARTPSIISLSGTATIFPCQKDQGDLQRGNADGTKKDVDTVNNANVHGEHNGGIVTYALRFDNLEYHTEVGATARPKNDRDTASCEDASAIVRAGSGFVVQLAAL